MAEDKTLYKAALACQESLSAIVRYSSRIEDAVNLESHNGDEWAEVRLADFNLWASGSGALSDDRASLDDRLRSLPNARKVVYRSLLMLETAVRDCESDDTRQSGRPLSGRRIIVDRLLGQLFTLTVSIRSLGVKTRLDRADKLFEIDRYEQLYNHLVISVFGSCLGNSKKFGIGDMLPHSTAPINNQDTKSATYQPDVSSFGASGIFKRVAQAPLTECFANEDFKAKRFFLWVTEPEISYVPIEEEIRTEEEQELSQENYSILQPMIPAQLSAPEATESKFIAFIFDQFTEVQKRLVEVNLRRRNRFICAQRHARRLQKQQGSEKKNKPESEQLNPSGRPEPSVSAAPRRQTEQMTQQQPSTPKEEMGQGHPETAVHSSRTKSSGTDPTMLEGDVKASGVSQPPMTVVSSTSLKVAYPRAPSIEGSKRSVFRCPCCCQDLPIVYAERSKWRKHLSEDILPYTCILPNCSQRLRMYRTRRDWELHMEKEHRSSNYWLCHACSPTSKWDTESCFEDHLRTSHESTIDLAFISTFSRACRRTSPEGLTSCPLCPPPAENDIMEPRMLLNHAAVHVHNFSMASLPWAVPSQQERAFVGVSGVDYFELENNPYFATGEEDDTLAQNEDSCSDGSGRAHEMSSPSTSFEKHGYDDYAVAWICTLPIGLAVATDMLDKEHEPLPQAADDKTMYVLGTVNGHNLVIASLPIEDDFSIASVISHMRRTFRQIRFALLVGIGGGVPRKTGEGSIRLGHVVVGSSTSRYPGFIQYDYRQSLAIGSLQRIGTLNRPPEVVLMADQQLSKSREIALEDPLIGHLKRIDTSLPNQRQCQYPGADRDHLLYEEIVDRENINIYTTEGGFPKRIAIHKGTVASGELAIEDASLRDKLAGRTNVLCFETEASGALTNLPCLVVRGISDYSDAHKNQDWQGYAAAVAAAYARELLFHLTTDQIKECRVAARDPEIGNLSTPESSPSVQERTGGDRSEQGESSSPEQMNSSDGTSLWGWLRKRILPAALNAPPPSVSKRAFSRNTTFRLQGIPALLHEEPISTEQVITLLKTAWNINDSVIITIWSLATDPLDNNKKVATLVFEIPPQTIAHPARKWTRILPGYAESLIELTLDVDFVGLTPLHRDPDADCKYDIVALPGLNGHAFGSFKKRGESNFMWVRDALPQRLAQAGVHARVFVYGYDSQLIKSDYFSEIPDLGLEFKNMMVRLTQSSAASGMNRLILIGHDLGGILVKQAIISLAENTVSIHEKQTLERLLGTMFFGTPSQGMDIETILPMVDGQPNELLVRSLGPSSGMLRKQMDDFRHSFERMSFSAVWYYETREGPTARQCENGKWMMDGPKRKLVDISSATNGMHYNYGRHQVRPVNRSHSEMVKFQGPTDEVYVQAFTDLRNIISSPISVMVYSLTSEQQEFLESLDFNRHDSRRDSIARATDNTCEWFFRSHEFQAWIDSERAIGGKGLLWVKGNRGVGKSTLMREALRRTQVHVSQASTSIVSFFFNALGEQLEKTTRGLYLSVLHQILKHDPNALAYLLPEYLERKKGKREDRVEWTEEVLKDYVSRVCRRGISMPVLVFIDALDECTDPEISRLVEFFQALVEQKKDAKASLRVCISSRHCPRPPTFGYPEITVEHHNADDIYTYIDTELKNHKSLLELRDQIFERSSGVFLWVRLAIKQLREEEDMYSGRPISFPKKGLTEIPPELGELFGSLLEKIPSAERSRAICMFQLVLFAQEPLSAEDIAAGISFHPSTRFQTIDEWTESDECINGLQNQMAMIVDLSSGLLEFSKYKHSTCQFIHESARDYFMNHEGFNRLSAPEIDPSVVGWCHSAIVTTITNYGRAIFANISEDISSQASKMSPTQENLTDPSSWFTDWVMEMRNMAIAKTPLALYMTKYIINHAEIAETEGISLEGPLRILIEMNTKVFSIAGDMVGIPGSGHEESLLHLCCRNGKSATASRLIAMEKDPRPTINRQDKGDGEYPLTLACLHDKCAQLVELLLRSGAEVDARNRNNKTALMKAASHNLNPDVIKHLLLYKADVQSRDNEGKTALHKGVRSEKVTKLLLDHGADPNVEDDEGRTPLIAAGSGAYFKSFQPLINVGAIVNHKTPSGETALHNALMHWSLHVRFDLEESVQEARQAIQNLIQNGLDLNVRDRSGNTVCDLWRNIEDSVREDDDAYRLWKEVELSLRPKN